MRTQTNTRRHFCFQAGLGAAAPLFTAAQSSSSPRPNIVLIIADDLGYGHLGCYGQTRIRTPNLDRMAREGARFTQAYAGCTVCAPSRSALMTGLHTGHTPVRSNDGGVPLLMEERTVAEVLQQTGYRTGIFGKWGLGDANTSGAPNKKGFDEFFGYLHQLHAHFYYTHFLWRNDRKQFLANRHDWRKEYTHDLIVREALGFIRKNKNNPFFLYLPVTIPHAELLVPDDSLAEYDGKFPETAFTSAPRFHYAPNPKPRATLAGMVTRLDRSVGQVFDLLAELGLDDQTIVLFTSDNGPDALNGNDPDFFRAAGPFRGYKSDLYEGGIRVPLIARWPSQIPSGTTVDHALASWDLFPTFAELAGAPKQQGLDGRSILGLLRGRSGEQPAPELYWETGSEKNLAQAARIGEWKVVRPAPGAPLEFYDLKRDPGEKTNLAAANAVRVSQFEAFLKQAHRPARPQKTYGPTDGRRYW